MVWYEREMVLERDSGMRERWCEREIVWYEREIYTCYLLYSLLESASGPRRQKKNGETYVDSFSAPRGKRLIHRHVFNHE